MPFVALVALAAVGIVASIALLGITVDATAKNLTADWLSSARTASINLRSDGTFASNGISRCIGEVGVLIDDSGVPTDLNVMDNAGKWHVDPMDTGSDYFLTMEFHSPQRFQMRWQVTSVVWKFHPAEMTLTNLNPSTKMDGTAGHCSLHA